MDRHNKKCLTDYEIGAYIDGKLPDFEKEAIENKKSICPNVVYIIHTPTPLPRSPPLPGISMLYSLRGLSLNPS